MTIIWMHTSANIFNIDFSLFSYLLVYIIYMMFPSRKDSENWMRFLLRKNLFSNVYLIYIQYTYMYKYICYVYIQCIKINFPKKGTHPIFQIFVSRKDRFIVRIGREIKYRYLDGHLKFFAVTQNRATYRSQSELASHWAIISMRKGDWKLSYRDKVNAWSARQAGIVDVKLTGNESELRAPRTISVHIRVNDASTTRAIRVRAT